MRRTEAGREEERQGQEYVQVGQKNRDAKMAGYSGAWRPPGLGPVASPSVGLLPAPISTSATGVMSPPEGPQGPASLSLIVHSPGMVPASEASMETRTEVSRGPEPRTTRHTYSPESAGETRCSRSSEPWV